MPRALLLTIGLLVCAVWSAGGAHHLGRQSTPGVQTAGSPVVVSGTVVDGVSGEPLARARVSLSNVPNSGVVELLRVPFDDSAGSPTDGGGHFSVEGQVAGKYFLSATMAGYTGNAFGQDDVSGTESGDGFLTLATSEHRRNIVIRLWPASAISGAVEDDRGRPIAGADVRAFRFVGWWVQAAASRTDDRGLYRFAGLPADTYVVRVSPLAGRSGFGAVYFPSADSVDASVPLTLSAGQVRSEVNITVDLSSAKPGAFSIAGQVVGAWISSVKIRLIEDSGSMSAELDAVDGQIDSTGHFRFDGMRGSHYRVQAFGFPQAGRGEAFTTVGSGRALMFSRNFRPDGRTPVGALPADRSLYADIPIELGPSAHNLVVPLQPAPRLGGQFVFTGSVSRPAPSRLSATPVIVRPAYRTDLGTIPVGGIGAGGEFASVGLPPSKYVFGFLPSFLDLGWYLGSIEADGRNVTGCAVELGPADLNNMIVRFTDKNTQIVGTVRNRNGMPQARARVVVFPVDDSCRHYLKLPSPEIIRQIRADAAGNFAISVIPGAYFVVAPAAGPGQSSATAGHLKSLEPSATVVRLHPGDSRSLQLRVH